MSKSSDYGIGFPGGLQIAFIALKLTNIINWSWFWVLSPMWISIILLILIYLTCILFCEGLKR